MDKPTNISQGVYFVSGKLNYKNGSFSEFTTTLEMLIPNNEKEGDDFLKAVTFKMATLGANKKPGIIGVTIQNIQMIGWR